MALHANRLNLPNMVDNQLKELVPPTEVYFNPYTIKSRSEKQQSKDTDLKVPKTNISTSVNSIYLTVHNKLKTINTNKATPKAIALPATVPSIPAPIAETLKTEPKMQRVENCANSSVKRSPPNMKSIPRITVDWETKCQERIRRQVTGPNDIRNYNTQQRAKEIVRQKRMLEDMLNEHQKLQQDRRTMAVEIQSMKNYLNDIRQRLDVSLRKLNEKKTIVAGTGRRKLIQPRTTPIFNRNANKVNTPGGTADGRGGLGGNQRTISVPSRLKKGKKT